jgi:hypothetical protein
LKNKKLFAILTLIAFMMTLVPMAAFAEAGVADRSRSRVEIDTQSAEANEDAKVAVKVFLWDSEFGAVNEFVYVATSRGTNSGDKVWVGTTEYAPITLSNSSADRDRGYYKIPVTASDGSVVVGITSNNSGNFYVAVGIDEDLARRGDLYDYATGTISAASAEGIGRQQLTFTAAAAGNLVVYGNTVTGDRGNYAIRDVSASATTSSKRYEMVATDTPARANGLDQYEVTFRLTTSAGVPVGTTEVRFSTSSNYMVAAAATKNTDPAGYVKIKVAATRANSYELKATQGSNSATIKLIFGSSSVENIRLISDDNQLVAKDSIFSFKFRLYDSSGAAVKFDLPEGTSLTGEELYQNSSYGNVRLDALKRPSGTNLPADIYKAAVTTNVSVKESEGDISVEIPIRATDREGDYQIRAALNSGKSAYINYKVQTQGAVTGITLSYEETGVALGGLTHEPTVNRIDAAGVKKKVILDDGDIRFSVNNSARGKVYTQETTVNGVTYKVGQFQATSDGSDAGVVTVTAVDTTNNAVATYELTVSLLTSYVKLTPPAVTPVNGDAVIVAQLVDSAGNPVALGDANDPRVEFQAYAVSTPEGAVVNIDTEDESKFRGSGKSTITVGSGVAGTVRLQVVVSGYVKEGDTEVYRTFTGNTDVVFSNTATGTAGVLTMIVGSNVYVSDNQAKYTDTPPFNQDGRVYVAVRPVAEAFGASVDWDKATQTVTMSTGSLVLYVTVGSPTIRIVEAGVTREYTSDASAQIIGEGRVVLPFRAIGEAFGYVVEWNADTQTVAYKAAGI